MKEFEMIMRILCFALLVIHWIVLLDLSLSKKPTNDMKHLCRSLFALEFVVVIGNLIFS